MNLYSTDDIIFALATAWAKSAIAVIRVSGKGCISLLAESFKCKGGLCSYSSNSAVFGKYLNIDDCIVTIYKDGHGYTGEEAAEISCHGGLETVKEILSSLKVCGMRPAEPGEFTLRAFLHGKMDLTRAEAVNELINSKTSASREMAFNRLNGALFSEIRKIKNRLLAVMAKIEVQLDYAEDEIGEDLAFPETEIEQILDMVNTVRSTYRAGVLFSQGAKIVLAGDTNSGKSSLFNMFLKEERAIVSPIQGTTRDFIEAQCSVNGIPVRLYDTAGLRESGDEIEAEGIKRSYNLIENADIILYLIDATRPESEVKFPVDERVITVYTKKDIAGEKACNGLMISNVSGEGFDSLCSVVYEKLTKDTNVSDAGTPVIESARQKENLDRAASSLEDALSHGKAMLPSDIIAIDIQEALEALGEITGEVTTDDILDRIFSDFCVGK